MYENEINSQEKGENNEERYFDRVESQNYSSYQSGQEAWKAQNGTSVSEDPGKKKRNKKEKKGFWGKAVMAIGLGAFFGAFAGLGFWGVCKSTGLLNQVNAGKVFSEVQGQSNNATLLLPNTQAEIKSTEKMDVSTGVSDVSGLVEEVMPAMVSIVNNGTEVMDFWGHTYTRESESSGTGIIIAENDDELLIVTNHHVAVDSTKLEVTFADGSTAEAKIKGMDADMDLAVVAVELKDIDEKTKAQISIATLGDSDDLKLGKPVIVIGNALGYGQSVTNGIISGLNRELKMEDGSEGTFIQTNAAVNPGNSGGALFNIHGEVIGIISSKIGGSAVEGMGYAIPISSANPIIADLMDRQTRGDKIEDEDLGYMGVSLQEITADARQYYNMPAGVFVYEVSPNTGAEAAGIIKGDIITKFEGERISSYEDLQSVMQYYAAGNTVSVTVSRQENGEYVEKELKVTLGERPKQ